MTIHAIEYIGRRDETAHLLRVTCGKGTYIRTLCHDIGAALGVGGHMAFLLRSAAGCFDVQSASTLEELKAAAEENRLETLLYPLDAPLEHIRAVRLGGQWSKSVMNGVPVRVPDETFAPDEIVRVYLNDAFAGIGQADESGLIRFRVCFGREALQL